MNQESDHTSDQVCYIFSFHYKLCPWVISSTSKLLFNFQLQIDACLSSLLTDGSKVFRTHYMLIRLMILFPSLGSITPPNLICVKSGSLIQLGTFLGWKSKVRKGERSDACLIVRQGPAHQVCQFLILPDGGKRKEE